MIRLSRLNGDVIALNPDLIAWIELTPDTTISLLGGERVMVREPLDTVEDRIIAFRRAVRGDGDAWPPREGALARASRPPESR
ncbi:MAG: flagellar FlbD family protein [Polyangiaceae bacterium]|nr:flagellar FlbD family protein [Polyangiaceae bacterium]